MLVREAAGGGRREFLCVALAVLACAVVALLAPAAASAVEVEYTVNSTGDQADASPGTGGCKTSVNTCTLRAAIEEANLSAGTDEILFNEIIFNGEQADTIALGSALPTITGTVFIEGHRCMTAAGFQGPCVGVSGPSGGFALQVKANGTWIRGLAITGALTGISVINGTTDFVAQNDWLGVKLDGSAGPDGTGIFLDPGSDRATVGGVLPTVRNVFANNNVGLDLEGASQTLIRGNYFGVRPDGSTQAANGKNIEVSDSTAGGGFKATENEIGGVLTTDAAATPECDESCNVISGAAIGVDLNGDGSGANEAPASGPTWVRGNYVGLDAAGTAVVANGQYGIFAGGADDALVGGTIPGETNYVDGGAYGIYAESGENFLARGNRIGFDASGAEALPPTAVGIFVFSLGVAEPATIDENDIRMVGGIGIEHRFVGATITQNFIEGGLTGIKTFASTEPAGSLIEGNVLEGPIDNGILVENDGNQIVGNFIFGSGDAGIRIKNPSLGLIATGNQVGGDTEADENVITASTDDAIEIVEESGEPGSENEVARNRGGSNEGLFINLLGTANGGILPPAFSSSLQSSASGSAEPGAKVRVFRKASAEAGELQSFLANAVADGSGNWKAFYPAAIPVGTIVAATQTNVLGGTSELATATSAADPGGGGGSKPPIVAVCDLQADSACAPGLRPQTIIFKGPKAKSAKTTAKFKFKSTVARSTFQCKLDKGKFSKCRSPKTYKKLKPGKHLFQVRATGPTGMVDRTPAKRKFTVAG